MKLSGPSPLELARLDKELSLRDLEEALEINRGSLSKIERGVVRTSPDVAIRIEKFFGGKLTRDQILFPEMYPAPPKKQVRSVPGRKPVQRVALQEA